MFVYLRVADQAPGGSGSDCKLGLTIVRPNSLSTSETVGYWTDDRMSCRQGTQTFLKESRKCVREEEMLQLPLG